MEEAAKSFNQNVYSPTKPPYDDKSCYSLLAHDLDDLISPTQLWREHDIESVMSEGNRCRISDKDTDEAWSNIIVNRYIRSTIVLTFYLTLFNAAEIRRSNIFQGHHRRSRVPGHLVRGRCIPGVVVGEVRTILNTIFEHTVLACSPVAAWSSVPMPAGSTVDWRARETTAPLARVIPVGTFA